MLLPGGALTIEAQYKYPGVPHGYSLPVTFNVFSVPVIKIPSPGAVVDMSFNVSGDNGVDAATGARLVLYKEPYVLVQSGSAAANGSWALTGNNLPPGPASLVAENEYQDFKSGRSRAVACRIRPPKLTVQHQQSAGSIKFSGADGYDGATVEIRVARWPGPTPPPEPAPVVVKDKQWETTAVGWPYGTYEVNCIQKVSDGANGWIEAIPTSLTIVVAVQPPTANYTVNERIPTFTGTGEDNATIIITDSAGTPVGVDEATVSDGAWTVTAHSAWAPVKDRIIRVVQRVGQFSSEPVVLRVNIDATAKPTDVDYRIENYTPVFAGKGIIGATIHIEDESGAPVATPFLLGTTDWMIPARDTWGPTHPARKIHVFQTKEGFPSEPVELFVTVPLAPPAIIGIDHIAGKERHVRVNGTGWSGAHVTLVFSDSETRHTVEVANGTWAFERTTPFAPAVVHTAIATQTFAGQTSVPESKEFIVDLPTPVITDPVTADDRWRDMTVRGSNGYTGASMQIYDAQSGRPLSRAQILNADGAWSIDLTDLPFGTLYIEARQSLNNPDYKASEFVSFQVTVLPPQITVPAEGVNVPRTSTLSGKAVPSAEVTVWQDGMAEPLLANIVVDHLGIWSGAVSLPVGVHSIWSQQKFEGITSKQSPVRTYTVVPAAPLIETPVTDEHIGRRVVVSGFGVPGDSVRVALGNAAQSVLQTSPVLEDRTWSVILELDRPGGHNTLLVTASLDGFESSASERTVVVGTYAPSIDAPAPGQWVTHPVGFKGKGRGGVGNVVSWFNPEQAWVPSVPVTGTGWQSTAQQPLPSGGQWCRFRQTITDGADGATLSDWVDSKRFEVERPAPES